MGQRFIPEVQKGLLPPAIPGVLNIPVYNPGITFGNRNNHGNNLRVY